jgi:hypothetical protein
MDTPLGPEARRFSVAVRTWGFWVKRRGVASISSESGRPCLVDEAAGTRWHRDRRRLQLSVLAEAWHVGYSPVPVDDTPKTQKDQSYNVAALT